MKDLNLLYRTVSMEASHGIMNAGIFDFLEQALKHSIFLGKPKHFAEQEIDAKYMSVRRSLVRRPVHLVDGANFLEYLKTLEKAYEKCLTTEERIFTPWQKEIGRLITNAEELGMLPMPIELDFLDLEKEKKAIGKFIDFETEMGAAPFGDMFANMNEWDKCNKLMKKLADESMEKNIVAKINDRIRDLSDLNTKLVKALERMEDRPSAVLKAVADRTMALAKEAEFLAGLAHEIRLASIALEEIADNLDK